MASQESKYLLNLFTLSISSLLFQQNTIHLQHLNSFTCKHLITSSLFSNHSSLADEVFAAEQFFRRLHPPRDSILPILHSYDLLVTRHTRGDTVSKM